MAATFPFPSTRTSGSDQTSFHQIQPTRSPRSSRMDSDGLGLESLSSNPQDTAVFPPEASRLHWQHLQQIQQQNAAGPSHFPIDHENMPQFHVIQNNPLPTSWIEDYDGHWFRTDKAQIEEVDSAGIPVNPQIARSVGMLSASATPPPAPRPKKRALDLESRSTKLRRSPSTSTFQGSDLQTMAASGFLYPHEPNLHEANQRLADHMLRSTGYVRAPTPQSSRWRPGPLSSQGENGNLLSPLTTTPAGVGVLKSRLHRQETLLHQSFTASDFGSLLAEKPRVGGGTTRFNPQTSKQLLADVLTHNPSAPPSSPTESLRTVTTTRQTHDHMEVDDDDNQDDPVNTRQRNEALSPELPQLPRVFGPIPQQKMPALRPPGATVLSEAATELLDTASLPSIPDTLPELQPALLHSLISKSRTSETPGTGRGSFATQSSRIPLSSTPPPRLRQRPPLRATTPWPGSSRRGRTEPPPPPRPHVPTPQAPGAPPVASTSRSRHPQPDVELLALISRSIAVAQGSVDNIRIFFMRVGHLYNVLPHTDTCHRVKTALSTLLTTLQRRERFTEEHMRLASQSWHSKYLERLGSTQRTLQKLAEFAAGLGDHQKPKLSATNKVWDKLAEYDTKLTNLCSKFNSLFDRLRVRHLHTQLTKEHAEATAMKRKAGFTEDVRIWAEGKVRRAHLRREFEAYRAGRRTSLIS